MITRKLFVLLIGLCIVSAVYSQNTPCGYDQVQQQLMDQNPDYRAEVQHYVSEVLPRLQSEASTRMPDLVTIPVVVHVIHTGQNVGNGANLSVQRITSQIDILNQDYRRMNEDADETPTEYVGIAADPEVQFCLASKNPDGDISSGITRHVYSNVPDIDYIENTIKPATSWDPDKYLNIWTIDMPNNSVIGYSYLPTPTIVGYPKDGVVIDYPNFGYVDAGNRGRTCIHEVGHYLGLQHTWGASDANGDPIGCSSDDGLTDTPSCSGPHYGCPDFGVTSCGTVDMISNYMEYVNDDCMNLFTQQQKDVMQANLNGIRSDLTNSALTACEEIDLDCGDLTTASFEMGFESNESANGWVVENTNGDARTWTISQNPSNDWGPNNGQGLAVYLWNSSQNADDYLFTPCFEMKADHTYKISFSSACAASNGTIYNEDFELGFSPLQSSSDFDVPNDDWVFENIANAYPNYNDHTLFYEANSDIFTSLGFHVYSPANQYALQIDDLSIEDLGQSSPVFDLKEETTISISPNPGNGIFNLNLDFETVQKSVSIRIYDIAGKVILENQLQNVSTHQSQFDLSTLNEGMYFVRIGSDRSQLSRKVVLVK